MRIIPAKKLPRVGVIIGHIETPYARTLVSGMMAAAKEAGAHLFIFPGMYERAYIGTMRRVDDTTENFMFSQIFDYAASQRLDRLIVSIDTVRAFAGVEAVIHARQKLGNIPTLVLESADESPHLTVDSQRGIRLAAEHLIKVHGFTRIGYIGGTKGNFGARLRREEFIKVLEENGIKAEETLMAEGDYTLHSGLKCTSQLLTRRPDIEAICCANDWMAVGAIRELENQGLSPGEDIAVTGLDDVDEALHTDPPLTTARTDIEAFGREAVQKVLALSGTEHEAASFSKEPELVVRGSCGCEWNLSHEETHHCCDNGAHHQEADRQKKRLRFISSVARDVLQQEEKAERLWHKLFYSTRNLRLGNLWIFTLDAPHPMNPGLAISAPWREMRLIGFHLAREINIYKEDDRPRIYGLPAAHLTKEAHGVVCFPVFAAREMYGIMAVEAAIENLPTLFAISIQAGTALQYIFLEREQKRLIRILNDQSQQYARKATLDELTGLLNRFGFTRKVDESISGHMSERAILAFADLDHLKHINDTLGHAAGDAAITTAADILRKGFGPGAVIGRMGGDEFVVFSCLGSEEQTDGILERVRQIAKEYNDTSGKPYYVEISLGLTEFRCDESINLTQLLKSADDCLYESKLKRRTTSIRGI